MTDTTETTTVETPSTKPAKKAAPKKVAKKASPKKAEKAPANGKPAKAKSEKGLSLMGAALKVLAGRTKPMTVGEIFEVITGKGMWTSPGGATPKATLSAALQREVAKGGKLKKVGPGQFLLKK